MAYCSTCGYPAPCGRCEDSDNPSARIADYTPRLSQMRSAEIDRAWRIGRYARIRGLDVKAANVELARQLKWEERNDFDDVLLDECERGWHAEDELRS